MSDQSTTLQPPNPQVKPSRWKRAGAWILLGSYAACVVIPVFKEGRTAKRLDQLAIRVLELETIKAAESAVKPPDSADVIRTLSEEEISNSRASIAERLAERHAEIDEPCTECFGMDLCEKHRDSPGAYIPPEAE
jgi:hypothetical protein